MLSLLRTRLPEVLRAGGPIVATVCVLQLVLVGASAALFLQFLAGSLLVVLGLVLLFAGIDLGVLPMGRFIGAELPFGDRTVRSHSPDDAYAAYVERARQHSAAHLAELGAAFAGRAGRMQRVLRRGQPEEVIREFVVADGIDLIVMGTVARSGIAGLLFGNTAERILHTVPCSVLAVKPDGFESPVRLDPA